MAALFIEFDDGKVISAKNYDASKGIQEWIIPNDSAKRRVRPS